MEPKRLQEQQKNLRASGCFHTADAGFKGIFQLIISIGNDGIILYILYILS